MNDVDEKKDEAVWIAHTLFQLGKTSGATGNLSFRDGENIYISRSGCCFGTMQKEDFSIIDLSGKLLNGSRPSREVPLHLAYYKRFEDVQAVIHTHGRYSVLWGCMPGLDEKDCMPEWTPYLKMRLGNIGMVPYEKPGSAELFAAFESHMDGEKGYLLRRHGAIVGGNSLMEAFYGIEELEESAFIAWNLQIGKNLVMDEIN